MAGWCTTYVQPDGDPFVREAAAAGCDTIGGLDMLVAQAEDQSEWWLGRRPPAGFMREAALAVLGQMRPPSDKL